MALSSSLRNPCLGKALRFLRENANLTQEEVADKSEIHVTSISHMERGKVNPSHDTLENVAKGLDVPLSYIFTLEEIFKRRKDR